MNRPNDRHLAHHVAHPDVVYPALAPEDAAHHATVASLLGALVDGELPPETVAQIDAHLAECVRCQREVKLHRTMAAAVGQVRGPVVSAALLTRIRQQVASVSPLPTAGLPLAESTAPQAQSPFRTFVSRPWLRRGVGAVMLLVVCLSGWLLFRSRLSDDTIPTSESPLIVMANAYQRVVAHDLPGRARDVEVIRAAMGIPVEPLSHPDLELVGAWTTTVEDELVGVLAYQWRGAVLLQFLLSESSALHLAAVRAQPARNPVPRGFVHGTLGLRVTRLPNGASVVAGPGPWREYPAERISDCQAPACSPN